MKVDFPLMFNEWPDSLPRDQDRAEVRLLSLMVTSGYVHFLLLKPIYYMLTVDPSPLNTVSYLANRPAVMLLFAFFVILCVPQLFALIFRPKLLSARLPRKMLVVSGIFSGVVWGYLAVLSWPLDYDGLATSYAANAFSSLAIGGVFGFSLNCQQLRAMVRLKENEQPSPVARI